MKTRLITFCSILLLAAIGSQDMSAQLAKGRKSLGVKTGYITLNKTATAESNCNMPSADTLYSPRASTMCFATRAWTD